MKEIKSPKTIKQHTKSIEKECEFYSKRTTKVLLEKSLHENITKFCNEKNLSEVGVREVLKSFPRDLITEEKAPLLLLEWLYAAQITSEKKIKKALNFVNKKTPELTAEFNSMYNDSQTIRKQHLHRNEKAYLRGMKVKLSHNADFYKYLVRKNLLVDYRKEENWKK